MGVPLVEGRDLAPLTRTELPLDALVSREMVRRHWPEGSPLGRRFAVGGNDYEVAGVVADARYRTLDEEPRPVAWLTLRAQAVSTPTLHIRSASGDPRGFDDWPEILKSDDEIGRQHDPPVGWRRGFMMIQHSEQQQRLVRGAALRGVGIDT